MKRKTHPLSISRPRPRLLFSVTKKNQQVGSTQSVIIVLDNWEAKVVGWVSSEGARAPFFFFSFCFVSLFFICDSSALDRAGSTRAMVMTAMAAFDRRQSLLSRPPSLSSLSETETKKNSELSLRARPPSTARRPSATPSPGASTSTSGTPTPTDHGGGRALHCRW